MRIPGARSAGWILRASALALACAGLFACTAPVPSAPETGTSAAAETAALTARYTELARAGEHILRLDPAGSSVRILAFRAGKAARLGHNHVLAAPRFVGFVQLPRAPGGTASFDLLIRPDELVLDEAPLRAELGPAFAGTLDAADIEATRAHMLGEEGLQAGRYPQVRLHGLALRGEAPHCAVLAQVELHGQRRELWLPVTLQEASGHFQAEGRFVLRQSDFGVTPYSVLGGALAVQDEVIVSFRLAGAALAP